MTDQSAQLKHIARSLLQKAVRRGCTQDVQRIWMYLESVGDADWLHKRAAVIVAEECWPLLVECDLSVRSCLDDIVKTAHTAKNKDAAGLSALAYAYSLGDRSSLPTTSIRDVVIVSEAIRRPGAFWNWILKSCGPDYARVARRLARAFQSGWPWDKALIQAAVYLIVTSREPPKPRPATEHMLLPIWVAIDKHTAIGKHALRTTARILGMDHERLTWSSFYFEGALTNKLEESAWWNREMTWRLARLGLTREEGIETWRKARPFMSDQVREYAANTAAALALNDELENIGLPVR